ncbi:MAG: hypothetical protein RMK29_03830 [Myxococcales bacterium]|nr:hypothetical protein [Myxococcota bacterium]MDW8280817.1 hypothetical protein [Myxococcales bacterium]
MVRRSGPHPVVLLVIVLLAASSAPAATTYRLGIGVQAGYNSALVQPVERLGESTGTVAAATLSLRPFVQLRTETGRISEIFSYQFLGEGMLVVQEVTPAFSYQNAIDSQTRLDLNPRVTWSVGISGSQGRLNSFAQIQNAGAQIIEAPNLVVQDFLAVSATSQLQAEATARLRLWQPVAFRAFIPYGTINRLNVETGEDEPINVTGALQSYSLDGGLGLDYELARARLGAELRAGCFLPQRGAGQAQAEAQPLVTGQALVRLNADLAPRWRVDLQAGAFVVTRADAFLRGRHIVGEGPTIRQVQSTLATPVGGLTLSYALPQVEALLLLSYQHTAMGEVFIGRMTLSDAITLRAVVPLPHRLGLSGSVGYRHADLFVGSTLARTDYRVNPLTQVDEAVSLGQTYDLFLTDAALSWAVRDGMSLFLRYTYQYQKVRGELMDDSQLGLQDFDRHLAVLGLSLHWPTDR